MAYQREVRLGLVLYGGVSLAVYENGIAQEIHRAIRGDGVYGLLAKLIDSDVVVDIISGTSAGGVNGIMLAYALANGLTFSPCAELWLDDGDIQKLMRSQSDQDPSSILDSNYYQDRLQSCYQNSLTRDPTAPTIGELDLFVTSTDVNGALSTVYDDLGHAVDIKNHRALFQLSYRGERKNDLAAPPADLAKLSRMTSCFPAAFKPVELTTADQNFFRWGRLRNPAIFLDGGILNNKPFTSTINAIANRTSTREVERFLIYVEPKPEQFDSAAPIPPAPPLVRAAIDSLTSIPGYQSIASDLQAIDAHNVRAARLQQILSEIHSAPLDPHEQPVENILASGVLLPAAEEQDAAAYYVARSIQIRDAAVSGILDDPDGRGYFPAAATTAPAAATASSPQDDRRSGRILVQSFDAWPGDGTITLQRFDVFFRMRRAVHLRKTLMRLAKGDPPATIPIDVPSEAWQTVNHYFKLYEMTRWAMMRRLMLYDLPWKTLSADNPTLDTQPKEVQQTILARVATTMWGQVITLMEPLLQASIPIPTAPTPDAREQFYTELVKVQDGKSTFAQGSVNLLDAIDNAFKQALINLLRSPLPATAAVGELLCSEFSRFPEIDRKLFFLQVGSDFESTDIIRVVRFSPLDAQRGLSAGPVKNKVRGIALGAFGGFFKKSWRANDIMMGRFDASCLLIECLLTRERLAALAPRRKITPISVTATELLQALPALKQPAAQDLANNINAYLADPNNASAESWNDIVNSLVEACHHDIFATDYPRVVQSAIEQEHLWGRYTDLPNTKSPSVYDSAKLGWIRGEQRPDETIVQVAAQALATLQIKPFAPGLNPPSPFTEEIPETILQELGALATSRLGKGILDSISRPGLREKLAESRFYKYPFGILAPTVYGWSKMRRTQPDSVVVFNTLVPAICTSAILVPGILWYLHSLSWRPALAFIAPALLILIGWNIAFRD
jgi:patatin-related protein